MPPDKETLQGRMEVNWNFIPFWEILYNKWNLNVFHDQGNLPSVSDLVFNPVSIFHKSTVPGNQVWPTTNPCWWPRYRHSLERRRKWDVSSGKVESNLCIDADRGAGAAKRRERKKRFYPKRNSSVMKFEEAEPNSSAFGGFPFDLSAVCLNVTKKPQWHPVSKFMAPAPGR